MYSAPRAAPAARPLTHKSDFEGPVFDMWGAAMASFLQSANVFRCDGACPEARAARAQILRTFPWAWDTVVRRRVEGLTAAPLQDSAAACFGNLNLAIAKCN